MHFCFDAQTKWRKGVSSLSEPSYAQFSNTVSSVLDTHAPLKKKKIRANNAPFMNKEIRKCNMKEMQQKTNIISVVHKRTGLFIKSLGIKVLNL